jgi:hypothetical protein
MDSQEVEFGGLNCHSDRIEEGANEKLPLRSEQKTATVNGETEAKQ